MDYYEEGYRNGHLDRFIGIEPLVVALTSRLPGYAMGYFDGYFRAARRDDG
jgi:hypothetical protein